MSTSPTPRNSTLKDTATKLLPIIFFIHFVSTGTVILIYTLALHKALPTKYTIGAAITFGTILALLAIAHLLIYCRRRFGTEADVETGSTSGSSNSGDSSSGPFGKVFSWLRQAFHQDEQPPTAFSPWPKHNEWEEEVQGEPEQRPRGSEEPSQASRMGGHSSGPSLAEDSGSRGARPVRPDNVHHQQTRGNVLGIQQDSILPIRHPTPDHYRNSLFGSQSKG